MALSATTIWEVETGGSDTLNGGAFDPGQTAGMLTDGAATVANTAAPIFSSASYNFVAGDVGAWVYIASGSNWTPGWYQITGVASNKATLNGTIGQAVLKAGTPTTVIGCATTASPTVATWTIDYSQQSAAQFAYTDLTSAGTGLAVSSSGHPFGKQQVGNCLVVTGSTSGFNNGRYVIASIGALNVATVVGPTNISTGAGVNGTGGLGGAVASPGQIAGLRVAGNTVWIKSGTYSITSASTNVSGGCISDTVGGATRTWEGYGSVRGDLGTAPLLQAGSISTFAIFTQTVASTAEGLIQNIDVDGTSKTSSQGFLLQRRSVIRLCNAKNCTNNGFNLSSSNNAIQCAATGCSTQVAFQTSGSLFDCVAYSNTSIGFMMSGAAVAFGCIAYSNSGASSDGFDLASSGIIVINCTAYGNGRDGFRGTGANAIQLINCISEGNAGDGFNSATTEYALLVNCGVYNNGTNFGANLTGPIYGSITNTTGSFFVNAASGNFALNNTANQGALARAAGIPGVTPDGLSTGYLDIGAIQHQSQLIIQSLIGTAVGKASFQ